MVEAVGDDVIFFTDSMLSGVVLPNSDAAILLVVFAAIFPFISRVLSFSGDSSWDEVEVTPPDISEATLS